MVYQGNTAFVHFFQYIRTICRVCMYLVSTNLGSINLKGAPKRDF